MRNSVSTFICALLALSACSFQNADEREAQKFTQAIMADDLAPVKGDLAPGVDVTRVQVAEWSAELAEYGKLKSVKEKPACDPGWHCFDVVFEKARYTEKLQRDEHGKVLGFSFHMAS